MNEVIRFALLGLGVGALYALASQGLIVIYRGTGVLNFSLGAIAIAGVFMQWELQNEHGWPFLASAFGLWLLYRSTQFGLATEAVSESERSAEAIGLSPNRIALLNWALGSGLAAVAGILVVPIITLQVTVMTSLILAAMAAALVGD